jgi:hypothetical protein
MSENIVPLALDKRPRAWRAGLLRTPAPFSLLPASHPRVWARSHHRLYPLRQASLSGEKPSGGWISDAAGQLVSNPAFAEETARVMKDTVPVECCGKAGTVVYASA